MLNTVDDISFIREAEMAILEYCKEVHELTYVEHGENNIVALVNHEYVFRFPRDEAAARRLVYETALLQKLKGKIDAVQIPDLQKVHTAPLYTVSTYIPGEHISGEEIQELPEGEQQAIGARIGTFIDQLNRTISGLEVRRLRTEANVDGLSVPPATRYQKLFGATALPNAKLQPVVQEFYTLWRQYAEQEQASYAIHDNLYPKNLLFTAGNLSGIVDFADANIGSIESELRGLFELGDVVLNAAIEQYQALSGATVVADHVRVWAIMQELAIFTTYLVRQQTETAIFKRAQQRLQQWVPGFPL
jgi:aminoglycoside 2''-phosphotransferase